MNIKEIKTIGIITHRGNYNYGGLLQALALQCWLQSQGFLVDIINLDKMQLSGTKVGRMVRLMLTPLDTINKLINSKKRSFVQAPPKQFLQIFSDFKTAAKMKYSPEVTADNIGDIANKYDIYCFKFIWFSN